MNEKDNEKAEGRKKEGKGQSERHSPFSPPSILTQQKFSDGAQAFGRRGRRKAAGFKGGGRARTMRGKLRGREVVADRRVVPPEDGESEVEEREAGKGGGRHAENRFVRSEARLRRKEARERSVAFSKWGRWGAGGIWRMESGCE